MYNASNELQRQVVSEALANLIGDAFVQKTLEWRWDRLAVSSVTGSTFDQAHRPASVYLARLIRHPEFLKLRAERSIRENDTFHVDKNGRIYHVHENSSSGGRPGNPPTYVTNHYFSRTDITRHVASVPALQEDLELLTKMAGTTAGFVTSNGRITIGQWLQFHGLTLPTSEQDTQALIDLLNYATLPASPRFENYWQLLDTPDDSPFRLTEQNRAIINRVSQALKVDDSPLVAQFGGWLILENTSSEKLPTSHDYRQQRLIDIARQNTEHGQPYLDALGWFTEETGAKPTQAFIEQLLVAALLLDLDPDADSANTSFAGFDLYSTHYLHRQPADVRDELQRHLKTRCALHPVIAPLVVDWVLAGMAPEYLVRDVHAELRLGSPGWVVFTQAVHLVEALVPGASRVMTYQHLLEFSQVAGLTPQLQALHTTHTIDPIITWALMNDLITREADGRLSEAALSQGIEEYNRYVGALSNGLDCISQPIPSRKVLALKELKTDIPDIDPDELLIKHRGSGGGAGRKVSVLDLYLGDELHTRNWGRIKGKDIYQAFPQLTQLYPAAHLYEEAIQAYYNATTTALSTTIRFIFSQMEESNRKFIERGHLGIYQVNEVETNVDYRPSAGFIFTSPPKTLQPEKDPARYGIIICAVMGSLIRCYELFPMRLECRSRQDLRTIVAPGLISHWADEDFNQQTLITNAPVDLDAYLKNVEPRDGMNSSFYLTRIGEFKTSTHPTQSSNPVRHFNSERIEAISDLIARKNPLFTEKELMQIGLDQTERERAIEKTDAVFNVILNLIIPFKECVEEMSSGVPERQRNAIAGCVMDAAVVGLAFAAIPLKVAGSVAKGASLTTKLLTASRVGASTVVSLLNPLDGVPSLLKGGAKLIGRGAIKVGHFAASSAQIARAQLRHLTGANAYDLIRALNHTGAASEIRMGLDTVAHARALFKSDGIETAEQVLKHLHTNDARLLKQVPEQELQHLLENALTDIARQSDDARSLAKVLDTDVVDSLTRQLAQKYSLDNLYQFPEHTVLPEIFNHILKVEYKNLIAMNRHQSTLLASDLGKSPYSGVLDELSFNPQRLTDNTDRATAWILKASNSRNEAQTISALLREYSRNGQSLTDPAVYKALHRNLAPEASNALRSPTAQARYPSNVSGAAMLERHLATLDPTHEHFGKQMLGSFLGYHSFVDGNGRIARAIYAITELRANRFNALSVPAENALSGLA